jgi:CubicO group peptidase (beta-lactamase class C family)
LAHFVKGGLSFSNAPEHGFEYSNLGFVMLGKVISRVAGVRYQDYITRTILLPLGMKNTLWEYSQAPVENFALGYRWEQEQWKIEPILHDGDAAAMGGLITTMDDFSKYLAFHLSAWPARDGVEDGPVRRSTVREMQQPSVYAGTSSKTTMVDGITPNQKISFYAKGLVWGRDSHDVVQVGHSGGLPGYGSQFRFAPEHGVGVVAFSNLRYGPVYAPTTKALNILIERAKLPMRTIMPSPVLLQRAAQVLELLKDWNETLAASMVADNFFLDRSRADWMAYASKEFAAIGTIKSMSKIKAENQLRGSFTISGQQGDLEIAFTLTPERNPKVQELKIKRLPASK